MNIKVVDCSFCSNCVRSACIVYGSDAEKSIRACTESGFRYFVRKICGGTSYKCIEPFQVKLCNNGIPTDDYLLIEKDSIWIVKDVASDFVGIVSLVEKETKIPLEITWGTLGIFFKQVEV